MTVHRPHWLDYDIVSFSVLMIAMSILEVLVLGI